VSAIFGILLVASTHAQIGLRRALDYDKDGKADFSIFRQSDQNWYILTSSGGVMVQNWGDPNQDFLTPGDYDGDGKSDISVYRVTTGVWFRLNSSDNTVSVIGWGGLDGDEPVARDYDGDGKTDIAIARRSNNVINWFVLQSLTGNPNITQWGASTDFLAPGDYDGDGKFDYCVQRPGATLTAPATFFALESSGAIAIAEWGQGNDSVVPGDYDGDGKTDLAVVRDGATTADPITWFIYNSGSGTVTSVQWGLTGDDLTTQNDYDGDGRTDIAIWRNSTGTFFIFRSLDGQVSVVSWGADSDVPVAGYDTH